MKKKIDKISNGESSFDRIDETVQNSTESALASTTTRDGFWGQDILPSPEEFAEATSRFWKKRGITEYSWFDKGRDFDCKRHAPSVYAVLPSALVEDDNIIETEFNEIDQIDELDEIDFDGLDIA